MRNEQFKTVYAEEIFEAAQKKEDKIFYNSSEDHAIIVHQALAKYAESYIDILSSSMCTEISNNNDYLAYIKEFLEKSASHRINIILLNYNEAFLSSPIAGILKKFPLQATVKRFGGQVMYNNKPVHFTVTDDRAFRIETDIEKHMAFGNFNSPTQAISLKNKFEKIFQSKLVESVNLC